jgi:hypothetical protein
MHETTTIRRMTARTAAAVLLAVVGMLALGGAWTSAFADAGGVPNGGANQSGPYDPTTVPCDNQGNGNSACNGTNPGAGHADDKNPPGQVGNTHDHGYECDDNKGIGNRGGNPAHSGNCVNDNTDPAGCTTEPCCEVNCGTPQTGCTNCGGITLSNPSGDTPRADVLGLTEEAPPAATGATPAANVAATELAFTGSTANALGFMALALLAFGGSFLLAARKPAEILAR